MSAAVHVPTTCSRCWELLWPLTALKGHLVTCSQLHCWELGLCTKAVGTKGITHLPSLPIKSPGAFHACWAATHSPT